MIMHRESIRDWIMVTLATRYEEDPHQFVTLSKRTLDSSLARGMVAELRNVGYVQEQVRGVIRMTRRGYMEYRSEPSLVFRESETPAFVFCASMSNSTVLVGQVDLTRLSLSTRP